MEKNKTKQHKKVSGGTLQQLYPHLWFLAGVFALILLGVGFETLAPWPFKILIDNVLGTEVLDPTSTVGHLLGFLKSREALGFFLVLVYGISNLLSSTTEYFVQISTKALGKKVIQEFAQKSFQNLEQLSIGFYRDTEIGDYIYKLSYDVSALGNVLEFGLIPLATNAAFLVFTTAVLFLLNYRLALVALAITPLLFLGLLIFNRAIGKVSARSENSNSLLFNFIEQSLRQLKIIQAFNQQKRQADVFKVREGESLEAEFAEDGLDYMLDLMIGALVAMGYSAVIFYGLHLVIIGLLSTGTLILFTFYLDNLTYPMMSVMDAASSLKEDYVKVARMNEFFESRHHLKDTGRSSQLPAGDIVFDRVSFETHGYPVLKNVSLTIPQGKLTAVVGASGSGKTTLISMIMRFAEPTTGSITIGGTPIAKYAADKLREGIAYVPQEVVLFDDTIRANITFGNPKATQREVNQAATLAVADKFIAHHGYDLVVGQDGNNLSGGQRQRLMIARAFLKKKAQVLVFDEPLSSLDIHTRAELLPNIKSFAAGKTAVIVSNTLEIIRQADNVIVISDGEITYSGNSAQLLKQSKLTSLLLNSQ